MPIDVEIQRSLLDVIAELSPAAHQAGQSDLAARLAAQQESLGDGRLRIAIVGEAGNGKSTLLNSLLGQPVAPTGMTPITHVPFQVGLGPDARAFLVFKDGVRLEAPLEDLTAIGEEQLSRVDRVEVELPHELLGEAIFLDTPGLGVADGAAPEVIEEIIRRSDAVVFVLNSDRLLSLTEQHFIQERLVDRGPERVVFVVNRCDGKTEREVDSLMDRARRVLDSLAPGAPVAPYSAVQALQGRMRQDESLLESADPAGLWRRVARDWLRSPRAALYSSARRKLSLEASELEARLQAMEADASASREQAEKQRQESVAALSAVQDRLDSTLGRAKGGLEAIREQFGVGLKDFALTLRENVPAELMQVPVDEARRFLPFFIQESLKRAVDENGEPVRLAVGQLLEMISGERTEAVRRLLAEFQVAVEPPAIPLYVPRERAPLSQGSSFLMFAGTLLMVSQTYVGALMLVSSLMSREIGRHLEAADRRASLANSAQALVHGSIDSMERSLDEQFQELESSVAGAIRDSFAPLLEEREHDLQRVQESTDSVTRSAEATAAAIHAAREHLQAARQRLAAVGALPETPEIPSAGASGIPAAPRGSSGQQAAADARGAVESSGAPGSAQASGEQTTASMAGALAVDASPSTGEGFGAQAAANDTPQAGNTVIQAPEHQAAASGSGDAEGEEAEGGETAESEVGESAPDAAAGEEEVPGTDPGEGRKRTRSGRGRSRSEES